MKLPDLELTLSPVLGSHIEVDNGKGTVTASIPKDLTPAELDPEQVEVLLRQNRRS